MFMNHNSFSSIPRDPPLVVRERVGKSSRGVGSQVVGDKMLESRRVSDTRSQSIESPQLLQETKDGSVSVLATVIDALGLNDSLANPR